MSHVDEVREAVRAVNGPPGSQSLDDSSRNHFGKQTANAGDGGGLATQLVSPRRILGRRLPRFARLLWPFRRRA